MKTFKDLGFTKTVKGIAGPIIQYSSKAYNGYAVDVYFDFLLQKVDISAPPFSIDVDLIEAITDTMITFNWINREGRHYASSEII